MLKHLVGPECTQTQVKNPEAVAFKPIDVLSDLCVIYTNLAEIPHFCKSVVKDDRSFRPEYLNQALRRLKINKAVENI